VEERKDRERPGHQVVERVVAQMHVATFQREVIFCLAEQILPPTGLPNQREAGARVVVPCPERANLDQKTDPENDSSGEMNLADAAP
jgi:hypothetical protein